MIRNFEIDVLQRVICDVPQEKTSTSQDVLRNLFFLWKVTYSPTNHQIQHGKNDLELVHINRYLLNVTYLTFFNYLMGINFRGDFAIFGHFRENKFPRKFLENLQPRKKIPAKFVTNNYNCIFLNKKLLTFLNFLLFLSDFFSP